MQFQYNADYPGLTEATQGQTSATDQLSRDPLDFPPAKPIPCARITTRIFHPDRNQVATVQNVLVRIAPAAFMDDDNSMSSSTSSDASDSDDSMKVDGAAGPATSNGFQTGGEGDGEHQNAYWVQRTIREAIYGRVLFAVVLKRRERLHETQDGAEWEVTTEHCAVKEMSWQHIRRERDRLAEDPIKEVSAMQYIKQWVEVKDFLIPKAETRVSEMFRAMRESNIMMPLDLLSDERNLYSIMPYCDGGELFERLDLNERFSEDEARYWMDQVLNGIENLQHVGICHRDMSLENLLVHKDGALVIDMGMCLRVPFPEASTNTPSNPSSNEASITASFNQMSMNGSMPQSNFPAPTAVTPPPPTSVSRRGRPRYLIRPQGTCGKWIYMSPEIYNNKEAFDGFAVDMWAAGVILFLMLTGFPPWERACPTDERFHYMTAGYLVQMLTEWEIGLSGDAMDLLQRMLFIDPKDRLGLDQVRAHPWMTNGARAQPLGLNRA